MNKSLSNPQKPTVVNAGVDTLYLNAYYADPETFCKMVKPLESEIQATLNTLQAHAKACQQDVPTHWMFHQSPLHMLAHGTGKLWLWILHNDLINIQIGTGDYGGLIAHVRVASEYLWQVNDLGMVLALVNGSLNRIFAHEMCLTASKIDVCADVAYWSMRDLNPRGFVTRCRKKQSTYEEESLLVGPLEVEQNGPHLGTLYFGKRKSAVHGKLYDKLREIQDKRYQKSWFFDLWKREGKWDGQSAVTRVEVSFSREALQEMDIDDAFDLISALRGLWAYAVGSSTVNGWLRYTKPTKDTNQTRWPLMPVWKVVQHAFDTLSSHDATDLIRIKKQQANIEQATAAITGYLTTRTVWECQAKGIPIDEIDMSMAFSTLYRDVERLLDKKKTDFTEQLQVKQTRYYLRQSKQRPVTVKPLVHPDTQDDEQYDSASESIA